MPDTPKRIQLRRTKGWRMPENTVKVDRSTRWGNPWTVAKARECGFLGSDAELATMCARLFKGGCDAGLPAVEQIAAGIGALRGKNLACWCRLDRPCHADTLLELANAPLKCEAPDA